MNLSRASYVMAMAFLHSPNMCYDDELRAAVELGAGQPNCGLDGAGQMATGSMSLRAWLSGQALAGMVVNPSPSISDDRLAQCCVQLADAVLVELQKGGTK